MSAPVLTTEAAVRELLELNADGASRYEASTINSNIRAAGAFLERRCGRFFGDQAMTLRFTTNGAAYVTLPGVRTVTSVTRAGSTLTADESYWLIPDTQQTGVFTGIQLRGFRSHDGAPWWFGVPDWWDRGLDMTPPGGHDSSPPNDLVVVGSVGYADADMPEEARKATTALAALLTLAGPAILTGDLTTESGAQDPNGLFEFVRAFIASWRVAPGVQAT